MQHLSLVQRLAREKDLHRYLTALEDGDFDAAAALLTQAAHDTVLTQMIFEFHATEQSEEALLTSSQKENTLAVESEITQAITVQQPQAKMPAPMQPFRPRRGARVMEQILAAVLVLAIVVSWFAISHLRHTSNATPASFNDANARSLGVPITTIQGNFSSATDWSPDGHTFASLQLDTQKQELEARLVDVTSGHSTLYPVLDTSWIPAFNQYNSFDILLGRYLVAERVQGQNQVAVEIWDITKQHAVTTRTITEQLTTGSQVNLPWLVPSQDEQKLAILSPDGSLSIWDVASGQTVVTCQDKASPSLLNNPHIQWYDHDQGMLLTGPTGNGQLDVWNTVTGAHIIHLNDTHQGYGYPIVSPNSKYLALPIGFPRTTNYYADSLEILDAHSGQVLHSYQLKDVTRETSVSFFWLPDSQRLLVRRSTSPSGGTSTFQGPSAQLSTWNVFTNQTTLLASLPQAGISLPTPDSQYFILGGVPVNYMSDPYGTHSGPDGPPLAIWQTSTARQVATVAVPRVYDTADSFTALSSQQMLLGEKGSFDIWDIATGEVLYKYRGPTPFSSDNLGPNYGGPSSILWSPDGKALIMMVEKPPVGDGSWGQGMLSIWRLP